MGKKIQILVLLWALCGAMTTALGAEKGYVKVPEGRLYYEISGEGTPLIFVHGHSLDRRMWREQVAFFEKHYRVIVYDARGYGKSSKQREDLLFTHCDDLVALMDALGIEKAHIVGLSMGGFIAGDLLAMHPERMLSCTLAEGHIRSTPSINHPMTEEERAAKQASIDAVKAKGMRTYKKEWFESLMNGGTKAERMRKPLWQQIRKWDGWQATHHEVHCYYAREAMEVLKERKPDVPTLFLSGRRPTGKLRTNPSMMNYLKNSRHEYIDDSGHMCNMEQPEAFNQKVFAFLAENSFERD